MSISSTFDAAGALADSSMMNSATSALSPSA